MASAARTSDAPLFDQPVAAPKAEAPPPLTVSGLTRSIKNILEPAFTDIIVEGEISGFSHNRNSGHRYWTLKDEGAQISCTFWKSRTASFEIASGQKVVCRGRLSVYAPKGGYQLDVYQVRPVGIGELQLAYERLYKKLSTEGLFDPGRKRAIPQFPCCIGVVTSANGAAFFDIVTAIRRRYPLCTIILRHAAVQGVGAELEIAQGIRDLNRMSAGKRPDLLIVGRGGGSLEDLWCFNEEAVARAIFASAIPVISAVGHEVDVTIADLVADLRAPTPTAAAELATPDIEDLKAEVAYAHRAATVRVRRRLEEIDYDMEHRIGVEAIADTLTSQIQGLIQSVLRSAQSTGAKLRHSIELHQLRLAKSQASLGALDPMRILDRGYALVRTADGRIVSSTAEFPLKAEVLLKDGTVQVERSS